MPDERVRRCNRAACDNCASWDNSATSGAHGPCARAGCAVRSHKALLLEKEIAGRALIKALLKSQEAALLAAMGTRHNMLNERTAET